MKLSVLVKKFHGKCFYCRRRVINNHPDLKPTRDHFIPLARSGSHDPRIPNIVLACHECNNRKGSELPLVLQEIEL